LSQSNMMLISWNRLGLLSHQPSHVHQLSSSSHNTNPTISATIIY
jgi:hypothetical protein